MALLIFWGFALGNQATFVYHDGTEKQVRFIELKADTLIFAVPSGIDTVENIEKLHKFEVRQVFLENDSLVDLNLSDFIPPEPEPETPVDSLIEKKPEVARGKAAVLVKSEPAGARVYIDDILQEGVAPLLVDSIKEGDHEISVRKYLKDVDWWGTEKVFLRDGDTTEVTVHVKRPRTAIKVQSLPTGAEVYLDGKKDLSKMPEHYTNVTFDSVRPGDQREVFLFKVGYHDTTLVVDVLPFETNLFFADLRPVEEPELLDQQQYFVWKRQMRQYGRWSMWASLVPLVAGGTLWYLAERDYQAAEDRKLVYDAAAIESAETRKMVSENNSYLESGDTKAIIAASMGGLALSMAAVGFVLWF